MRIGKSAALHFSGQIARSLAGFVGTLVIARVLGSEGLGAYAVAVAFTTWVNIPTSTISRSVTKRMSEGHHPRESIGAGLITQAVAILALAGLLAAFRGPLATWVGRDIVPLVTLLLVGTGTYSVVQGALKGEKRVGLVGVVDAVEQVLRTVVQVAVLLAGYAVGGLVLGHAASLVAMALVGLAVLSVRPAVPTLAHVRDLLEFARYNWLNVFQTRSFAWMDTVVLAFFVGPSLIGIYEVAWRLASVLGLLTISIQQALFPEMSELSATGDIDQVKHLINEGFVYTGLFVIPGLVGAAILGRQVLQIYRPEFTQGVTVLLVLICARIASAYSLPLVNAVNAVDRPDVVFRIDVAFIVTNLVLNVVLVMWIGWYGAAIATAVSMGVTVVLGYVALRELVGPPSLPLGEIGRQIVASGVMGVVVWMSTLVLPPNHYVTVGQVALGGVVYSTVLLAISGRVRQKSLALTSAVI